MPFAKLFRNRWSALLWAGGVLWTAYDVAGAAPSPRPAKASADAAAAVDATGAPVDKSDLATLANLSGTGN